MDRLWLNEEVHFVMSLKYDMSISAFEFEKITKSTIVKMDYEMKPFCTPSQEHNLRNAAVPWRVAMQYGKRLKLNYSRDGA